MRKVIKTGLGEAVDRVRSLIWQFQRLPLDASEILKKFTLAQGIRVQSTRVTSKIDLCPQRVQAPSAERGLGSPGLQLSWFVAILSIWKVPRGWRK